MHISRAQDTAAPDLVNAEVLQVIRSAERSGRVTAERSSIARQALIDLPITRYPTLALVERAWALRHNFSAYDAMYVALAEAAEMPLVTADERLAAATRAHTSVEVVSLSD